MGSSPAVRDSPENGPRGCGGSPITGTVSPERTRSLGSPTLTLLMNATNPPVTGSHRTRWSAIPFSLRRNIYLTWRAITLPVEICYERAGRGKTLYVFFNYLDRWMFRHLVIPTFRAADSERSSLQRQSEPHSAESQTAVQGSPHLIM
jgi:hypothetical protein